MCECDFPDQKQNPLGDTFAQPCLNIILVNTRNQDQGVNEQITNFYSRI